MHKLEDLKVKLIEELEDYSQNGKFSKEDVESIKYMASAVDHLCHIIDEYSDDYSGAYMDGRMDRSFARGRNARRDAMGRYSNEGYSRAMDDVTSEVRRLMNEAPNEKVKQELHRTLTRIEQM